MTALILRRLLQAIPVLFIVVSLTFLLVRSAPGNPFSNGEEHPAGNHGAAREAVRPARHDLRTSTGNT